MAATPIKILYLPLASCCTLPAIAPGNILPGAMIAMHLFMDATAALFATGLALVRERRGSC